MELLKSVLNVLRNLCKACDTCKSIFEVADSVDILVELLQMYRDKYDIFLKAASVLRHICKIRDQREVRLTSNILDPVYSPTGLRRQL